MRRRILKKEWRLIGIPVLKSVRVEVSGDGKAATSIKAPETTPTYIIGSWTLKECMKKLERKAEEDMNIVSGVNFENFRMMERMSEFRLSRQNFCGVEGDISSILTSLIEIEENGYSFNSWFHIHPGKGQGSTKESSIDIKTQRLLEDGKYVAIGGVFSRDGYVRFFSDRLEFKVMVLGEGVEKIDENLFKISTDS